MDDEMLAEIAERAESAATDGNNGHFVTSLIEVAEHDVPDLIAEIRRLRNELGNRPTDKEN